VGIAPYAGRAQTLVGATAPGRPKTGGNHAGVPDFTRTGGRSGATVPTQGVCYRTQDVSWYPASLFAPGQQPGNHLIAIFAGFPIEEHQLGIDLFHRFILTVINKVFDFFR